MPSSPHGRHQVTSVAWRKQPYLAVGKVDMDSGTFLGLLELDRRASRRRWRAVSQRIITLG
jgi:hypothetical protein